MLGKLQKVARLKDEDRRLAYAQKMLTAHLQGREHRDYIRDHYSELSDELEHLLTDLEERLDLEFSLSDDRPNILLNRVRQETESRVRRAISNLRDGEQRVIADGQVADWLMRCPLDFAEPPGVNP